jgi:hypothetical protein
LIKEEQKLLYEVWEEPNRFYSEIISQLNIKNDLFKLGSVFSYNYADEHKVHIKSNDLIEIDIKSAFPTICKVIFRNDVELMNILNSFDTENSLIEDATKIKLDKNRRMTNYLKFDLEKKTGVNYLVILNNYTKLIIFGYVLNNYDVFNIFEYKKDSLLFSGIKRDFPLICEFNKLLEINNFIFHNKTYEQYARLFLTSYYLNQHNLIIKGKYKEVSILLKEIILDIFYKKFQNISRIYNRTYFELANKNNINLDYFRIGDKVHPFNIILSDILYPLIYLALGN